MSNGDALVNFIVICIPRICCMWISRKAIIRYTNWG